MKPQKFGFWQQPRRLSSIRFADLQILTYTSQHILFLAGTLD
jgi:hypothetical protein